MIDRWRLLLLPPRGAVENMARDAALLDRARESGEAVFSVYSWERPALSLGRNQAALGFYDPAAIEREGLDVVRRPTGGRALLHWHEVTYSVTAPVSEGEPLVTSYERINRILIRGLAAIGVEAIESAGGVSILPSGDLPCFAAPARGELVVDGKKLVGSAQFRERGALLQHGSILIGDDQHLIDSLLCAGVSAAPPQRAATLEMALGWAPGVGDVADALFGAVRALEDRDAEFIDEAALASRMPGHRLHYANALWTWRR